MTSDSEALAGFTASAEVSMCHYIIFSFTNELITFSYTEELALSMLQIFLLSFETVLTIK